VVLLLFSVSERLTLQRLLKISEATLRCAGASKDLTSLGASDWFYGPTECRKPETLNINVDFLWCLQLCDFWTA